MQSTFPNSIIDKPGFDIRRGLEIHFDDFIFHIFIKVLQIFL
jgi:hypothetical protein